MFAVDAVAAVHVLDKPAREVAEGAVDRELAAGCGIFAGSRVQTAVLRFSPFRARWVSRETWHPAQRGGRPGADRRFRAPRVDRRRPRG